MLLDENKSKSETKFDQQDLSLQLNRYENLAKALNIALEMHVAQDCPSQKMWNMTLNSILKITESENGFISGIKLNESDERTIKIYSLYIKGKESYDNYTFAEGKYDDNNFALFSIVNTILDDGKLVIQNKNQASDIDSNDSFTLKSISSFLGIPVYHRDKLVGVYGVFDSNTIYDSSISELLQPLSTILGCIITNNQNAGQRDAMKQSMYLSEQWYRAIFDSLPIGIALTDKDGNIIDINASCESVIGLTKEELYKGSFLDGKTIINIDGKPKLKEEMALYRAIKENRSISEEESGVKTASGEVHWLSVNAAPLSEKYEGAIVLFSDITKRRLAEDKLQDQHKFLNAILNGMDMAVFVLDVDLNDKNIRFNSGNATYERYNGFSNSELVGKTIESLTDYFSPDSINKLLSHCNICCETKQQCEYEEIFYLGGQEAWWLNRLTPLMNEDNIVFRIIGTSSLITDRVITERKLRDINAELEGLAIELDNRVKERTIELQRSLAAERELNILRDTFAGVIAHQFRTPLTIILSSVEILRLYGFSLSAEKLNKLFQRIFSAITSIQNLLDTIQKIEEVDEKIRSMKLMPINCSFLLQTTVDNFLLTSDRNRNISQNVPETLVAFADEYMLRSIIVELLSNAVRYSPADTAITISAERASNSVIISIKDKGIGIEPVEVNRIFEPFYRPKETENVFGVGLGLAIAKRYIVAMHGTISCESAPGFGSTFYINLPIGNKNNKA